LKTSLAQERIAEVSGKFYIGFYIIVPTISRKLKTSLAQERVDQVSGKFYQDSI
jgi:hypothetical protein